MSTYETSLNTNLDEFSINISTTFGNFENNKNLNLFPQLLIGPLKIRFKIIDNNQVIF